MALELGNKFSQQLENCVLHGPLLPMMGPLMSMAAMGANKPKTPLPPPPPPPPIPLPDPRSRKAEAESEDVLRRKIMGRGRSGTILTDDTQTGRNARVAGAPARSFENKTLGEG